MQAQPSVLSLPARWKAPQPAGAGLNNLGNSCFLNSTLQCLAYLPPLGHLCLSRGHSSACPRSSSASGPCTFCLLERQLAALLRGPRGSSLSPGEVVRQLPCISRCFVRGRQEDSHEFLTALLEVLERDGRRAAGAPKGTRTLVEDLFLGRWQSQVRCLACGHESNSYESFTTLPLDIGQARSVSEGLRCFTEQERLDGDNKYRCDRCRTLAPAVKQTTIWDDPNVLVLHLKRFDAGSLLGKISRHVAFSEVLDLQPFMTPPAARRRAEEQQQRQLQQRQREEQQQQQQGGGGGEQPAAAAGRHNGQHQLADAAAANGNGNGHAHHPHPHPRQHEHHHHHAHEHSHQHHQQHHYSDSSAMDTDPPQAPTASTHHHPHPTGPTTTTTTGPTTSPGPSLYTLTGVLVHQGSSLHSGHYYALVRDSDDRWSCMNDSRVYGASLEAVRQEQAYLLFYTRQSMKQPRPAPQSAATVADAAAAEVAAGGAGDEVVGPARPAKVYGPPLPPNWVRRRSDGGGSEKAGGGSSAAAAASKAVPESSLPQLPQPLSAAQMGAAAGSRQVGSMGGARVTVSAKLPARPAAAPAAPAAAPAAAAAAAVPKTEPAPLPAHYPPYRHSEHEQHQQQRSQVRGPPAAPGVTAVPPPPAASSAAAAGDAAAGTSRKRKLEEQTAAASAPTPEHPAAPPAPPSSPTSRLRASLEAELAAIKSLPSWGEGSKRLKLSLLAKLRESEWRGKAREVVLGMMAAGLTLQQTLGTGRSDSRRQGLLRAVPAGVLQHGKEVLEGMLRGLLPLLLGPVWLL
ncbi:hypothetical protein Agub_g8649 [Astrephomene gubernaculifera]|uniref:Ubiquitin carboxyl-terminal hydrolase n=1 Tax=Astrephomene gubernaculifera TaxID=47775 RepID=A0AAD3DS09_9CHLO|nr:hypothetical protein Agub_g8649 [Astrephomene gubernaculifera]